MILSGNFFPLSVVFRFLVYSSMILEIIFPWNDWSILRWYFLCGMNKNRLWYYARWYSKTCSVEWSLLVICAYFLWYTYWILERCRRGMNRQSAALVRIYLRKFAKPLPLHVLRPNVRVNVPVQHQFSTLHSTASHAKVNLLLHVLLQFCAMRGAIRIVVVAIAHRAIPAPKRPFQPRAKQTISCTCTRTISFRRKPLFWSLYVKVLWAFMSVLRGPRHHQSALWQPNVDHS